jgi:hypothetical protein
LTEVNLNFCRLRRPTEVNSTLTFINYVVDGRLNFSVVVGDDLMQVPLSLSVGAFVARNRLVLGASVDRILGNTNKNDGR